MNRDSFHLLSKFIHFNDIKYPGYDPNDENREITRGAPISRTQMRTVYSPGRELTVDESLILFKGRLHFKQFIRTKRARFGIKLYELTTSNGITIDTLVYCGKGMFNDDDPLSDSPTTERIPQVLMQPFLGKGHALYTDNFYTSPALAKYMIDNKTHLCVSIKSTRRNYAKELMNVKLEKGNVAF